MNEYLFEDAFHKQSLINFLQVLQHGELYNTKVYKIRQKHPRNIQDGVLDRLTKKNNKQTNKPALINYASCEKKKLEQSPIKC